MTASTAPTQPPDKCPACGAAGKFIKDKDSAYYGSVLFECGCTWDGLEFSGQSCHYAFSAAIQKDIQIKGLQAMREADHEQMHALRAERDDLQAMYQRAWTEIGELRAERDAARARLAELQTENAAQQRNITFKANEIVNLRHEYNRMIAEFSALRAALASGGVVEGETK